MLPACANFQPPAPEDAAPILERTLYDAAGNITGSVEVSFAGSLYGRGCQALTISPEGDVDYLMQQDASSDYSSIRGLAAIVPETVAVLLNPVSSMLNALVLSLGGTQQMQAPSDIHGCDNLYELNQPRDPELEAPPNDTG
jgi:hypothetical protein